MVPKKSSSTRAKRSRRSTKNTATRSLARLICCSARFRTFECGRPWAICDKYLWTNLLVDWLRKIRSSDLSLKTRELTANLELGAEKNSAHLRCDGVSFCCCP